ncbi:hypothetical protein A3841_08815 [Pontibacter flavimaris]|uniref:Uncharacterized protein n=1 Tax=Pontibacter flavimaris TaxID=1797110 RepID=A0A1Q5PIP7_9BACT|nr:hypothetical protein A3841_08815 [Pontibacter flavimaris]
MRICHRLSTQPSTRSKVALKLSLLGLQVQREGPGPVEPECEQTLDEIIRQLAVLNIPDPQDDPA